MSSVEVSKMLSALKTYGPVETSSSHMTVLERHLGMSIRARPEISQVLDYCSVSDFRDGEFFRTCHAGDLGRRKFCSPARIRWMAGSQKLAGVPDRISRCGNA